MTELSGCLPPAESAVITSPVDAMMAASGHTRFVAKRIVAALEQAGWTLSPLSTPNTEGQPAFLEACPEDREAER